MQPALKKIEVFTDGSCLGNPGPGGYGVVLRYNGHTKELSCGYFMTTNNRMELMAAIAALESLKAPCDVTITTDSQYVRKGITEWVAGWKRNKWMTSKKEPVKNQDLWVRLDALCQAHKVQWLWVKGHAGHPENERCDVIARTAAEAHHLHINDGGFVQ